MPDYMNKKQDNGGNKTASSAEESVGSLQDEFKFYLENQDDFLKRYEGRFIVIKNRKVLGSYESEIEAYKEIQKEHQLGTCLIQLVQEGENSYSQTFYSRVSV